MLRTIARLGAGALLGLACLLAPAGSAAAADGGLLLDVPGDGAGFVDESTTPLLNFDNLMPGDSKSAEVGVKNDHSKLVALSLEAVEVRNFENGCPEPERNEGGDTTCDGVDGELPPWLNLTLTRTDTGDDVVLWSGDLSDLTAGKVLLAGDMPSGAVWTVRVSVTFDPAAGNVTMTDEVEFDLAWSALDNTGEPPPETTPNEEPGPEGPGLGPDNPQGGGEASPPEIAGESEILDEVQIAGVQAMRPDAVVPGVTLPFTGVRVESWLVWFAGVLTLGGGGLMVLSKMPPTAAQALRRSRG